VTLGLSDWISVASAVVFVGLGIGIYLIRRVDVWVLMGITALVTRMGGYHRVYDDGLILLAELALWRVAQAGGITPGTRVTSELLLVVNAVVMLCPARFLDYSEYAWSPGWMWICTTMQAAVWLSSLGFLIVFAGRNPRPLHTQ
jgi:hypothetical protein